VGELSIRTTPIPGLLVVDLPLPGDKRGWFKENWQREKMTALGLPDFGPVQNNISFNDKAGATRGIHAEPWDKFVSVATGRIFGVWVDLRDGPTFGTPYSVEMGPETAVFVPRGVGNGYQTLADDTVYSYLVNDHWNPEAREKYVYLNLADETVDIPWPLPLGEAELSESDRAHPRLADVRPMRPRHTLVLGADGQLGRALRDALPSAEHLSRDQLDIADGVAVQGWDWSAYDVIINAGAYTKVDQAETAPGREAAWLTNAHAVSRLAGMANRHHATLVHLSTDYVFDGSRDLYREDDPFSPLGVYGQSKAAGDIGAAGASRHYIVRTGWVIGEGHNFVRTMTGLAERGVRPQVIDDQHGRLTFTKDLAAAIVHLVTTAAPYGTYNMTSSGPMTTWHDIARETFRLCGRDPDDVTPVSTEEYAEGKQLAPRPLNSVLDLAKIEAAGYSPRDGLEQLRSYVESARASA